MGKKLKLGFIISICTICAFIKMPDTFAATTARLEWRGSDSINVGQELVVNIWGAGITGSNLMGAGGTVTSSDTNCLTLVKLEKVAPGTANGSVFAYSDMDGSSSDLNLTKATFKAGNNACSTSINITNGKLAFTDSTKLTSPTVSKTITVRSPGNDASLKTLVPSTGTLSPAFNSNTTSYTISGLPATTGSINFNATTTDSKASIVSGKSCNLNNKTTNCNIVVRAEDGTQKTYTIVVTKNDPDPVAPTKSNDATLKSLSASGYNLVPGFTANNTNYQIEAASNAREIKFDAIPNHTKATVVSGTTCSLTDKTTNCNIVVRAEDGTEKTYTVSVTKRDEQPDTPKLNSDATLKSLDISGYTLSPRFNSNNTTYNMTVKNNINSLNVSAIANDPNAKVVVTGNSGWKEGNNVIRITVTAQDGSEKVYIVNVNKKAADEQPSNKSDNNFLSNIIVNDGELTPSFDKNTNSYSIKVPNDVTKLDLKAIVEDNKAIINITGNDNLKMGMNVITIEVAAEDGTIRVYTLNVDRSEKVSQNKLKELFIKDGDLSPKFDKDIYEYSIDVIGVNKLDLTAIPEFETSKVEVIGNENLKVGNNAVLIKVTDENGFVQYYRLNVNKAKKTFLGLTFTTWMIILGTLLIVGLLLWILFLLLKKRKKDEETAPVGSSIIKEAPKTSPVIEFKPEFNFGSKNGTDDDIVEPGGVLNQYSGITKEESKILEAKEAPNATYKEVPYDPYDETVTKDEIFDALHEALETKDPAKLQILYEQERLNRKKEEIKKAEQEKLNREERLNRYK